MYKIGLKLWSTNTDCYFEEAKRLYAKGIFSYVELYVIPDTLESIEKWKTLKIPINIHCPHFLHKFNLADPAKYESNRDIYNQVKTFADELNSEYIIFHGGIGGEIEETAKQSKEFNDPRALIENKPYKPRPEILVDKVCRGATLEEIRYVISEVGCGFCLDIGHAICSANSQKINIWNYIEEFNKLNPQVYHLTDLYEVTSVFDTHAHFWHGTMDVKKALTFIPKDSMLTVETEKSNKTDLQDFEKDVECIKIFA